MIWNSALTTTNKHVIRTKRKELKHKHTTVLYIFGLYVKADIEIPGYNKGDQCNSPILIRRMGMLLATNTPCHSVNDSLSHH